ncbi:hypothetical protein AX762_10925 [Alkalibacterium sp. 20]|nr:hypothetical protein AX762_10925 [Alkalibacterium sp. 20]
MEFIQRSIELNGPILMFEVLFLIGGIILIAAGYKIKEKSKSSGVVSIVVGSIIVLLSIYVMFSTLIFRLNS